MILLVLMDWLHSFPAILSLPLHLTGDSDVPLWLWQYHLSEEARMELQGTVAKVVPKQLLVESTALETWFEDAAGKLAQDIRKFADDSRKSAPDLHDKIASFAILFEDAIKIAQDVGVFNALVWLAREYVTSMYVARAEHRRSTSSDRTEGAPCCERWLSRIELSLVQSTLFSNLAAQQTALNLGEWIDEDGYVRDSDPIKHKHLLGELRRIKDGSQGPFRSPSRLVI